MDRLKAVKDRRRKKHICIGMIGLGGAKEADLEIDTHTLQQR